MRFIYIVDDDRVARNFMQIAISRDTDTLVRCFDSGVAFLAEAADLDPGILLLDFHMPGLTGTEVLEKLKARGDGKFVPILVTGTASVSAAVLAMKYGAADVIEKPVAPEALAIALTLAAGRLEACSNASQMARAARSRIETLTGRERDVLSHLFDGCPNKVIAQDLGISPRTVEIYRAGAMKKLGVQHLAHAVRIAVIAGWTPVRDNKNGHWQDAAHPPATLNGVETKNPLA